jgi:hypothetical protein
MNTFKKPETLLALSSFMGVIGVTIYFYRQQLLMRKAIDSLSENVGSLSKNVGEMKIYGTQIATISRAIGKFKDDNDKIRGEISEQIDNVDEYKMMIENIVYTLEQNGMEIKTPQKVAFKKSKQPAKSSMKSSVKKPTRKAKHVESEEEQDDDDEKDEEERTEDDEVDQAIQSVRYNSTRR